MSLTQNLRPEAGKALVVAPGSLDARNTLSQPDRVDVADLATRRDGNALVLDMPALSVAVVTIKTGKAQ